MEEEKKTEGWRVVLIREIGKTIRKLSDSWTVRIGGTAAVLGWLAVKGYLPQWLTDWAVSFAAAVNPSLLGG